MEIIKLEWTDEQKANDATHYNHVIARSPLGTYCITWKGWKENPSYDVELDPYGYMTSGVSLEDAKAKAQMLFEENVKQCLIV